MNGRTQVIIGLILGSLGMALIVTRAGFLPASLAAYLSEPVRFGMVIAGGFYAVFGVLTAIGAGLSGGDRGAARREEERQRRALSAFEELLVGATVRMVGADGVVAESELAMVQSVLEKYGQSPVDERTIRSIAQASHEDPDRYLNMIRERGEILSTEQKTKILRACLLVAMADVMLDPEELEYLRRVAEALDLPDETVAAVRQELQNVTQQLVGAAAHLA